MMITLQDRFIEGPDIQVFNGGDCVETVDFDHINFRIVTASHSGKMFPQDQLRENLRQATLDFLNYDRVSDFGDPSDSGSRHSKSNLQRHFAKYLTPPKMTTRATQRPFVRVIYRANALVQTDQIV
jgi:hypothetical protein